MRLVAEPYLPFALWIALAVIAAAVWGWYVVSSRLPVAGKVAWSIYGLMAATLALPLLVLLNLTWIESVPPPAGKPVVQVLVDGSASMATTDVDGKSRYQAAIDVVREAQAELSEHFDFRIQTFGQATRPSSMEELDAGDAAENETDIGAAIRSVLKEDVLQGQSILLLSDGVHNAGAVGDVVESAKQARAMAVPLFAAPLGGDVGVQNVAVSPRSPQELAFVGQPVQTIANIEAVGVVGQRLKVQLWFAGQVVDTKEVQVTPENQGKPVEAMFELSQETPGLFSYELRVTPLQDEATLMDNRAPLLLRVLDRKIKILLVEGKPYWDTKFLVRRLAADPAVELTSVIRMAEGRYMQRMVRAVGEGDASAAESTHIIRDVEEVLSDDSLADVQVVVLGRNAEFFLGDESLVAVKNWISREGGSLVCARGAPTAQVSQRLNQILPVSWDAGRENRFRVSMTTQGKDLRWLANFADEDVLGAMPSLATVATARRRGLASVLASTVATESAAGDETVPVLSYQPYGAGRTVVVEGAGMWRWALMAPEHEDKEQVYETLWRSLLRWLVSRAGLSPGEDIALQPDRISYESGAEATATMLIRPTKIKSPPKISVMGKDDAGKMIFEQQFQPQPLGDDPGTYRVNFGKLKAGRYAVRPAESLTGVGSNVQSAFVVRDRWDEKLYLDARPDLMKRIADVSGGQVLEQADAKSFSSQFEAHLKQSRPPKYRRIPMWDRWWILGSILLLWSCCWVVRRKSGLI